MGSRQSYPGAAMMRGWDVGFRIAAASGAIYWRSVEQWVKVMTWPVRAK